jgi:hypothetical protein
LLWFETQIEAPLGSQKSVTLRKQQLMIPSSRASEDALQRGVANALEPGLDRKGQLTKLHHGTNASLDKALR